MNPDELYHRAGEILRYRNTEGVTRENIPQFLESLQEHLRGIQQWIEPVYGSDAYADSQLIDRIHQLKYQAGSVINRFPTGMDELYSSLVDFQRQLRDRYPIPLDPKDPNSI